MSLKQSNFLITMNSNKTLPKAFIATIYERFYRKIKKFIKFNHREPEYDKIKRIKGEYSTEIGSVYKKTHVHAIIRIWHRSNISLDYDKMRDYFSEIIGTTVHLNGKYFPREDYEKIKHYIFKEKENGKRDTRQKSEESEGISE